MPRLAGCGSTVGQVWAIEEHVRPKLWGRAVIVLCYVCAMTRIQQGQQPSNDNPSVAREGVALGPCVHQSRRSVCRYVATTMAAMKGTALVCMGPVWCVCWRSGHVAAVRGHRRQRHRAEQGWQQSRRRRLGQAWTREQRPTSKGRGFRGGWLTGGLDTGRSWDASRARCRQKRAR
jgi:hypothetical protein